MAGPLAGGHFSYLFIKVRDFRKALAFYRDILGLEVYYLEEDRCVFMRLRDQPPAIALYAGRQPPVSEENYWHFSIDVAGLDEVVTTMKERGAPFDSIQDVPNGRAASVRDPDGNIIQLHEPN